MYGFKGSGVRGYMVCMEYMGYMRVYGVYNTLNTVSQIISIVFLQWFVAAFLNPDSLQAT